MNIIDTRGTGFIRVTEHDSGDKMLIPVGSLGPIQRRFSSRTGMEMKHSPGNFWVVQETEQEILDKIREAMAEPVTVPSGQPVIDWRWVPKKWSWFAVDEDGEGFYYDVRPNKRHSTWWPNGEYHSSAGFYNPAGWENSLQMRPGGV